MITLYDNLTKDEAALCSLVLDASYIPHRLRRRDGGFALLVDEHNHDRAVHAIEAYYRENRKEIAFSAAGPEAAHHGYAGVWIAAFLGAVHFYVYGTARMRDFWDAFGASAARINDGEIYRTVTALMLHADFTHLAGNMLGMAVFGTAVAQVAGWGVASLLILFAGMSGNMANALVVPDNHLSIGASTAVFGAIGILSAYQFVSKRRKGGHRFRLWLPVLGGVALLAFLGTGPRVDLGAHLFGFLAGLLAGLLYAAFRTGPQRESVQWGCVLVASGIVLFSWLTAYLGA